MLNFQNRSVFLGTLPPSENLMFGHFYINFSPEVVFDFLNIEPTKGSKKTGPKHSLSVK